MLSEHLQLPADVVMQTPVSVLGVDAPLCCAEAHVFRALGLIHVDQSHGAAPQVLGEHRCCTSEQTQGVSTVGMSLAGFAAGENA